MHMRRWTMVVGCICSLVLGFIGSTPTAAAAPAGRSSAMSGATRYITVQGAVSCASHRLQGVWVSSFQGGSNFATWTATSPNGFDGIFRITLPITYWTTVQPHVGCGGNVNNWWSDNEPQSTFVTDSTTLVVNCHEGTVQPPPGVGLRCTNSPTTAELAAMTWAKQWLTKDYDHGLCLTFVLNAYEKGTAGIYLPPFVPNYAFNSNTYPQNIWGNAPISPLTAGAVSQTSQGYIMKGLFGAGSTPPPGALVFYNDNNNITLSHITLSVGGGNTISTADTFNGVVHYETLTQHAQSGAYNTYVGWWLPA